MFVKDITKHLSELEVIGLLFETQLLHCLQVPRELIGIPLAKDLNGGVDLGLFDPLVLVCLALKLLIILPG